MLAHRIVYIFALAASVFFHALYPFWISEFIMVVIILLIPFDLILSLPGMISRRVNLNGPRTVEQGGAGTVYVTTLQRKRFPAGSIKARLIIHGNGSQVKRRIKCGPADKSELRLRVDTARSGCFTYQLKRIHNTSLLGLFSLVIKVDRSVKLLVLPEPKKPPDTAYLPVGQTLTTKPGGGFSENFDLRPYRAGDPMRIIHHKLSAKLDSLIVREPLFPRRSDRLVAVAEWTTAIERDIILSRLRWISDYLIERELAFYVKFGKDGFACEITSRDEFMKYLFTLLDTAVTAYATDAGAESCPDSYSWVFLVDAGGGGETVS